MARSNKNTEAPKLLKNSYDHLYHQSTRTTAVTQYSKRDADGESYEHISEIIHRVALSIAIAELRYVCTPKQLVKLTLDKAIAHPTVVEWSNRFEAAIGNQKFWANTPANINADPEVSLKVLQYEAYGKIGGWSEEQIWRSTEKMRNESSFDTADTWYLQMVRLAKELHGKGGLAACGVAYIDDTLEGIQDAARMEAIATKASMGMGLNTSPLRPWSSITSLGAAASGPDRFYEKTISKAVEAVAQGGRRGGALIELRDVWHPDILFFIDKKKLIPKPVLKDIYQEVRKGIDDDAAALAKAEQIFGERFYEYLDRQKYLKNTNITVLVPDEFMQCVRDKQWYRMKFEGRDWDKPIYDPRRPTGAVNKNTKEPIYEEYTVDLDKYPGAGYKTPHAIVSGSRIRCESGWVYAPEVMDRIVENMADSGEPGIMFYDLINRDNPNKHIYDLNTCNPCGEQVLPAGRGKDGKVYLGTCNLSSMNVAHDAYFQNGKFDKYEFVKTVDLQQRFMDNVTDVSWYPLADQNWTARAERRNGGGFAGIAEFLVKSDAAFGSDKGCDLVRDLFKAYCHQALRSSAALAETRGVYPLWSGSEFDKAGWKVRNACMVNNAPTGTLAQMMQTTWGIEPFDGIVFSRKVRTNKVDFVAPGFEAVMRKRGAWRDDIHKIIRDKGGFGGKSVRGLKEVPDSVQSLFRIRLEITPDEYVKHLAACYEGARDILKGLCMNSISNTCTIQADYDAFKILDSIMQAHASGVKAITFYPDAARISQPIEVIDKKKEEVRAESLFDVLTPQPKDVPVVPQRNRVDIESTEGITYKVKVGADVGLKTLHVTMNHASGKPGELIEIYARMGKNGDAGPFEALGRVISAFLQYAAQFGQSERQFAEDLIVKQLVDIQSGYTAFHKFPNEEKAKVIQSACDGLAKAIMHYRKIYPTPVQADMTDAREILPGWSLGESLIVMTNPTGVQVVRDVKVITCPKCSRDMTKIDGCWNCTECGYSKC